MKCLICDREMREGKYFVCAPQCEEELTTILVKDRKNIKEEAKVIELKERIKRTEGKNISSLYR